MKTTSVRLLSWTQHPIETIYVEWLQSRSEGRVPDPSEVAALLEVIRKRKSLGTATPADLEYERDVMETFEKVVSMKIPVAETIDFVFLLEHCPIALREQIVRHRIGHRFGSRLGADVVPDLAESTFWSQTTRVLNLGTFASEGEYLLPESVRGPEKKITVRGKEMSVEDFYREQMGWIQSAYNRLIEAGVPVEDARNLLPMATQHRLTWKMNLSALMHVVSKRGCWIAQLGMWEPVIRGVIEELAMKVHPSFRKLIDPPCVGNDGNFKECVFKLENENRMKKEDPYSPCPLYLNNHHGYSASDFQNGDATSFQKTEITVRGERYRKLWGRDEWTGKKL